MHTLEDMAELLYEEKNFRGFIEKSLEANYFRLCCPYYDETSKYPCQPFSPHPLTSCFFGYSFIECAEELRLGKDELKNIFMNLILPQVPFTITRTQAWERMEQQLINEGL